MLLFASLPLRYHRWCPVGVLTCGKTDGADLSRIQDVYVSSLFRSSAVARRFDEIDRGRVISTAELALMSGWVRDAIYRPRDMITIRDMDMMFIRFVVIRMQFSYVLVWRLRWMISACCRATVRFNSVTVSWCH